MHRNQALIATIIRLSERLQNDAVSQISLILKEHYAHTLNFQVILLRSVSKESDPPTLLELSDELPAGIRFIPERVAKVGIDIDSNFIEANVFTLEIASGPFIRKNRSLNLQEAKHFIYEAIVAMVGPCHDSSIESPSAEKNTPLDPNINSSTTLRLHLPRAPQSLSPLLGVDRTSGLVIKMLYEGLCRMNANDEAELAVAQEIKISEDKKKYTFTLKKTYWSNGMEVTASDFERGWKKILEPDFYSPYSFLFFAIKNAESIKRGEKSMSQLGLHVLDSRTLQVELEYPTPFFLDLTANWIYSPLSPVIHCEETHVGNGPFKLDAWNLDDSLQIVRNPLYWDIESVKLEKIQISIIEDEKKAYAKFLNGELDWIGDPLNKIPPNKAIELQKEGSLQTDQRNFGLFWLQMNMGRLPFQNTKIRQAFAYAANRKDLIEKVLHSQDIPAFGFSYRAAPPLHPPFKDGDQITALKLFEEGLSELGITRKDLPPIVISHSEIEEQEALGRALGEQWKELFGIEVKYNRMLWNSYFEALNRNDLHIGGIAWFTRFADPLYYYNLFIFREHSVRITSWKNGHYQKIIERARETTDESEKEKLLEEAEKILLEAMPVIPLFYQQLRYVKNPRLKDAILSVTNQIDFRIAYLED